MFSVLQDALSYTGQRTLMSSRSECCCKQKNDLKGQDVILQLPPFSTDQKLKNDYLAFLAGVRVNDRDISGWSFCTSKCT